MSCEKIKNNHNRGVSDRYREISMSLHKVLMCDRIWNTVCNSDYLHSGNQCIPVSDSKVKPNGNIII